MKIIFFLVFRRGWRISKLLKLPLQPGSFNHLPELLFLGQNPGNISAHFRQIRRSQLRVAVAGNGAVQPGVLKDKSEFPAVYIVGICMALPVQQLLNGMLLQKFQNFRFFLGMLGGNQLLLVICAGTVVAGIELQAGEFSNSTDEFLLRLLRGFGVGFRVKFRIGFFELGWLMGSLPLFPRLLTLLLFGALVFVMDNQQHRRQQNQNRKQKNANNNVQNCFLFVQSPTSPFSVFRIPHNRLNSN